MSYSFTIQEKDGYLLLTASGTLGSVEDLATATRTMHEEAARFRCRRFLVDERAVDKTIDQHDVIVFAESRVDDQENRLRVAVVYTPENVSRLRWMETFFQNRSLSYRQFSSLEKAEQWLMSPGEA